MTDPNPRLTAMEDARAVEGESVREEIARALQTADWVARRMTWDGTRDEARSAAIAAGLESGPIPQVFLNQADAIIPMIARLARLSPPTNSKIEALREVLAALEAALELPAAVRSLQCAKPGTSLHGERQTKVTEARAQIIAAVNTIRELLDARSKGGTDDAASPCPLPYDVKIGSVVFKKGVDLSTFVTAARRWFEEYAKPLTQNDRLSFNNSTLASPPQPEAPRQEPTPEEIERRASNYHSHDQWVAMSEAEREEHRRRWRVHLTQEVEAPRQDDEGARIQVELEAALAAATARCEGMSDALKIAQASLATMTAPHAIRQTTVQHAWAQAVEAEQKAREALSQGDTK